jgi:hypothetical protein
VQTHSPGSEKIKEFQSDVPATRTTLLLYLFLRPSMLPLKLHVEKEEDNARGAG